MGVPRFKGCNVEGLLLGPTASGCTSDAGVWYQSIWNKHPGPALMLDRWVDGSRCTTARNPATSSNLSPGHPNSLAQHVHPPQECIISRNALDGVMVRAGASPKVINCRIDSNRGAGISLQVGEHEAGGGITWCRDSRALAQRLKRKKKHALLWLPLKHTVACFTATGSLPETWSTPRMQQDCGGELRGNRVYGNARGPALVRAVAVIEDKAGHQPSQPACRA